MWRLEFELRALAMRERAKRRCKLCDKLIRRLVKRQSQHRYYCSLKCLNKNFVIQARNKYHADKWVEKAIGNYATPPKTRSKLSHGKNG